MEDRELKNKSDTPVSLARLRIVKGNQWERISWQDSIYVHLGICVGRNVPLEKGGGRGHSRKLEQPDAGEIVYLLYTLKLTGKWRDPKGGGIQNNIQGI